MKVRVSSTPVVIVIINILQIVAEDLDTGSAYSC